MYRRFLHIRQDMAVDLERDRDVDVAKTLANDLDVDTIAQEGGGVGVTKAVEADLQASFARQPAKLLREVKRIDHLAIISREYQRRAP